MIRFLFIYLLFFFILFGNVIIGEFIARKLPKANFSKWWEKNIIGKCKECD
jgi:uncharacterized protein YneF (UPF0154 family)